MISSEMGCAGQAAEFGGQTTDGAGWQAVFQRSGGFEGGFAGGGGRVSWPWRRRADLYAIPPISARRTLIIELFGMQTVLLL
jgi:hypothetical protein